MSITKPAANVSMTARSIITRLQASAETLTTKVEFKCTVCRDTGMTEQAGRYKQCQSCPEEQIIPSSDPKAKFF